MYKNLFILSFLFLLLSFSNSMAQEDCKNPITQADMNICSAKDFQQIDKELNVLYNKALDRIKGEGSEELEKFKSIQRSWIKYRDLNCQYASDVYKGGSMAPLIHATCMADLTRERISAIQSLFPEPLE